MTDLAIIPCVMFISKMLTDLCAIRKNRNKESFCRYCLQYFSSKKVLVEHKKNCLKVNCKQSIKSRIEID